MPHPTTISHQLATLRLYGALVERREDWGGKLVLACGSNAAASGIPVAVSIAGGAALAIDSDAAAMKSAMRSGELDFVVTTLDEALRTLKNEIRQRRALSVGLIADFASATSEMAQRGVQPDLLLIGSTQPAHTILHDISIQTIEARGMAVRHMTAHDGDSPSPAVAFSQMEYKETYLTATDAPALAAIDERLLAIFPPEDIVRRRWIQQLPRYLREARAGGRLTWLTAEEERALNA
jgi:hypothetical protein